MGVIKTSTTNRFGIKRTTTVRTNRLEDLVINAVGKLLGRGREWRLVHFIEKRKLKAEHS